MLELLLCSLLTIFPDYSVRRYVQGKRLGREITLFSVWFELRWGIIACLMLTVGLITVIFYNHPSTTSATLFFRTVPILPETNGRVAEVYLGLTAEVKQGAPIFRLDSATPGGGGRDRPAQDRRDRGGPGERAGRHPGGARAGSQEARSAAQQALDELETKEELNRRNSGTVALREIERLQQPGGGPRGLGGGRGRGARRRPRRSLDPAAGPEGQRRGGAGRRPRWS